MKSINHYTADKHKSEFDKYANTPDKFLTFGWKNLHNRLKLAVGWPLIIFGLPQSGKSYWTFNALINLSKIYGFKHFLFTPEMGMPEQVLATIAEIYVGKPIKKIKPNGKENIYAMTDAEREGAYNWIREHFVVVDRVDFKNKDVILLKDVYELADEFEREGGWKFRTITIDPWAEIFEDAITYGRNDLAISADITRMREDGFENKRSTIIINHAQTSPIYDKNTNSMRYPVPAPSQVSGGTMWWKRGFTMVLLYRPDPRFEELAEENETWVTIQKFKPKGSAHVGKATLFWDWKTQRYYEQEIPPHSPMLFAANTLDEFKKMRPDIYDVLPSEQKTQQGYKIDDDDLPELDGEKPPF